MMCCDVPLRPAPGIPRSLHFVCSRPLTLREGGVGRTLVVMTATAQAGVCNVPNRTIFEGDNLDVMRGMNDGCVDLIYLDPPFNSNRDYAAPSSTFIRVVALASASLHLQGV